MRYGCFRLARARVRRVMLPRARCDKSRVGEALCRVGLDVAIARLTASERSWGTAGEEDSSGRRRLLRCRAPLKLVERVAPSAPTTLLRLKQTTQHVVFYSSERAKPAIRLDGARYNKLHTPLLCGHRHSPPAKRSH